MRNDQWDILKKLVQGKSEKLHTALIVDSPWIPGYFGISTIDYLTIPEVWFQSNMELYRRFPDVLFLPGFWVEMGMLAEPTGFGCRMSFFPNTPPVVYPIISDIGEVDNLHIPDPRKDGVMPLILARYKETLPKIQAEGMDIKIVAARGPLALATHLMGVTEFLIAMKIDPEKTHKFLEITTRTVIEWLEAQAECLSGVEGIMVLDDIMGFMSEEDYLEFAHPYFKKIFSMTNGIKFLHNDTPNPVSFQHLDDLGVDIFNFSHKASIPEVRGLTGGKVTLMGNISPLDIMVHGTPEENYLEASRIIKENNKHPKFLFSAGGGVSMGTPDANIRAISRSVAENNSNNV